MWNISNITQLFADLHPEIEFKEKKSNIDVKKYEHLKRICIKILVKRLTMT